MSDEIRVELRGVRELQYKLDSLQSGVRQRIVQAGLQAAADVFANALRAAAPVRTTRGERPPGELRDSVATKVTVAPNGSEGTARIGFEHLGQLAHWLEFGHNIKSGKGASSKTVGYAKPHPFVRAAADAARTAALQAFVDTVKEQLKEAK